MKPSSEYRQAQTFGLVLVGEPKSGKSRVLMSFPGIYIQDWDRNLQSVLRIAPKLEFYYDDPYINDKGEPIPEQDLWEENINKRLKLAVADPRVKTVALDSISTLSDALVAHIKKLVRIQEGKTIDQLRIQDYQTFRTLFIRLITYLRGFNKYVIFTAHQKIDKDELTGILRYRFNIPGQLADNLGGFFSDVWGTEATKTDPVSYRLLVQPSVRHVDLGNSLGLERTSDNKKILSLDMTDKTPDQIWSLIGPRISPQPPAVAETKQPTTK